MQACADRQSDTVKIRHKWKLIPKNMMSVRVAEAGAIYPNTSLKVTEDPSPLMWTWWNLCTLQPNTPSFSEEASTQPATYFYRQGTQQKTLIVIMAFNKSMESLIWRVSFCHHDRWLWLWRAFLTSNNPRCREALGASPVLCLGLTSSFLYLHFFQNMI